MKHFLYYEKLFYSPLSQTEILNRVQTTIVNPVSQWQELWKPNPIQPYYGYVDNENGFFEIERPTGHRNKFFPFVEGVTEAAPAIESGTFVRLSMNLPKLTRYFALFWFFGVGLICIGVLITRVVTWASFVPFGMFAVALLSFWVEVWRIKRRYSTLLGLVEMSEIF